MGIAVVELRARRSARLAVEHIVVSFVAVHDRRSRGDSCMNAWWDLWLDSTISMYGIPMVLYDIVMVLYVGPMVLFGVLMVLFGVLMVLYGPLMVLYGAALVLSRWLHIFCLAWRTSLYGVPMFLYGS
jgi:hypothetical protein